MAYGAVPRMHPQNVNQITQNQENTDRGVFARVNTKYRTYENN